MFHWSEAGYLKYAMGYDANITDYVASSDNSPIYPASDQWNMPSSTACLWAWYMLVAILRIVSRLLMPQAATASPTVEFPVPLK
jgi:hypothetical protein